MYCGVTRTPAWAPPPHKGSLDLHSEIPAEGSQLPAQSGLSQPRRCVLHQPQAQGGHSEEINEQGEATAGEDSGSIWGEKQLELRGPAEDHTLSLWVLCGQVQGQPGRGTLVAVSRAGGLMEGWSGTLSWEEGYFRAGKEEMEKQIHK